MSTRQENQKILMATHLPTFKRLKIADPYFIAKSAWAPPGEALKMQFFPNELKQGKDIYTEFSDFNAVSEDPTHTLYKLKHNPFYKEEYPLEQKTSKSGNDYEVYVVPIEELVAINKKTGKEIPYNTYQDYLKNPPKEEEVETKPADFPNFAEEYLDVKLKKKEEDDPNYVPWKVEGIKDQENLKNFPDWLNTLDRIASALEKIEKKIK
tara:strand:- start:4130 stop:4756 length:627 start_codon:yes stop_codon:yes gene_type:complete